MDYRSDVIRRRNHFGIAVLILLLWVGFAAVLTHRFSVPFFFCFLHPFTVIEAFLLQWFDWAWILTDLLIVLSLVGWLLLYKDVRAGRYLLIGSQCVILAADAIITPLHMINSMSLYTMFGGRMPSTLGSVALLGLTCAVYPIVVIVLTIKWKPHIKKQA